MTDNLLETGAWLRVKKKNIESAPDLPSELIEWVNEINPTNNPK